MGNLCVGGEPMRELQKGSMAVSAQFADAVGREWHSVEELEKFSGISKWTWRRWAQTGRIASAKVSTRLLISRSEYERIMREATRPRKASKG
jgi:hypothetical protein